MRLALCAGSFALDVENGKATIDDILDIACRFHFQGIEVRDDLLFHKESDLVRIREMVGKQGIEVIYATKNRFLNTDLSQMKQSCERIRECIDETKTIGSDILKVSFGQIDSINDLSCDHFRLIRDTTDYAESKGVVVCAENADKYLGGRPDTIKKVMDEIMSPVFKVNYDCGNFAIWGQDPIEALKLLLDEVYYIHLKDVKTDTPEMTNPGDGRIDFGTILRILDKAGYKGFTCFEFPMGIDRLGLIQESIRYLNKLTPA